jgi:hypothetical protein
MIIIESSIWNIIFTIIGMFVIILGNYHLKKEDDKGIKFIKNKGIYILLIGIITFLLPFIIAGV